MSFSEDCKKEITQIPLEKNCCKLSECMALFQTVGRLSFLGKGKMNVSFKIDSLSLARYIFVLIQKIFSFAPQIHSVTTARFGGTRKCIITLGPVYSPIFLEKLQMVSLDEQQVPTFHSAVPKLPILKNCCMRAYLRGIFLGAGHVMNPETQYHLELIYPNEPVRAILARCFQKLSIPIKESKRREKNYFYIKKADDIVTLLTALSASNSVLKIVNLRMTRQVMLQVNRALNCDNANLEKQMLASNTHVNNIQRLIDKDLLKKIPPALYDIAIARINFPGATLTELGQVMTPPLSKSAVNHRLRRLQQWINEHNI